MDDDDFPPEPPVRAPADLKQVYDESKFMSAEEVRNSWFLSVDENLLLPNSGDADDGYKMLPSCSMIEDQPAECIPVISFVGHTAQGKTRLVSQLINKDDFERGVRPHVHPPTSDGPMTADVSIFRGRSLADIWVKTKKYTGEPFSATYIVDCEGSNAVSTGVLAKFLKINAAWLGAGLGKKPQADIDMRRKKLVDNVLPVIMCSISDVVVYVTKNALTDASTIQEIYEFAKKAYKATESTPWKPVLVVVRNQVNPTEARPSSECTSLFLDTVRRYDANKVAESLKSIADALLLDGEPAQQSKPPAEKTELETYFTKVLACYVVQKQNFPAHDLLPNDVTDSLYQTIRNALLVVAMNPERREVDARTYFKYVRESCRVARIGAINAGTANLSNAFTAVTLIGNDSLASATRFFNLLWSAVPAPSRNLETFAQVQMLALSLLTSAIMKRTKRKSLSRWQPADPNATESTMAAVAVADESDSKLFAAVVRMVRFFLRDTEKSLPCTATFWNLRVWKCTQSQYGHGDGHRHPKVLIPWPGDFEAEAALPPAWLSGLIKASFPKQAFPLVRSLTGDLVSASEQAVKAAGQPPVAFPFDWVRAPDADTVCALSMKVAPLKYRFASSLMASVQMAKPLPTENRIVETLFEHKVHPLWQPVESLTAMEELPLDAAKPKAGNYGLSRLVAHKVVTFQDTLNLQTTLLAAADKPGAAQASGNAAVGRAGFQVLYLQACHLVDRVNEFYKRLDSKTRTNAETFHQYLCLICAGPNANMPLSCNHAFCDDCGEALKASRMPCPICKQNPIASQEAAHTTPWVPPRVLSIDSCGMRVIASAMTLARLVKRVEELSGSKKTVAVGDLFDLIAGTGFGGALAVTLALRVQPSTAIENLVKPIGTSIFWYKPYLSGGSNGTLERLGQPILADSANNKLLAFPAFPKLLIPSACRQTGPGQPFDMVYWRNFANEDRGGDTQMLARFGDDAVDLTPTPSVSTAQTDETILRKDVMPITAPLDILKLTCATPSYFYEEIRYQSGEYFDGTLFASNPAAIAEAHVRYLAANGPVAAVVTSNGTILYEALNDVKADGFVHLQQKQRSHPTVHVSVGGGCPKNYAEYTTMWLPKVPSLVSQWKSPEAIHETLAAQYQADYPPETSPYVRLQLNGKVGEASLFMHKDNLMADHTADVAAYLAGDGQRAVDEAAVKLLAAQFSFVMRTVPSRTLGTIAFTLAPRSRESFEPDYTKLKFDVRAKVDDDAPQTLAAKFSAPGEPPFYVVEIPLNKRCYIEGFLIAPATAKGSLRSFPLAGCPFFLDTGLHAQLNEDTSN